MRAIALVFAGLIAGTAGAEDTDATSQDSVFIDRLDGDLSQFVWTNRPVVVFADSPIDPNFAQQMEYLRELEHELIERDVIVLTDTDPDARSDLRRALRPRGFVLVLIGKDGDVKLRKPFPYDVRELSRTIDKMPIRQREIQDRRSTVGG